MIGGKQIKELQAAVTDLEGQILTGALAPEDYKAKCAARRAYLKSIEMIKTISGEEEDES